MCYEKNYSVIGKLAVFFLCLTLLCTLGLSVCVSMTAASFDIEDNIFFVMENDSGTRWSHLYQANIFESDLISPGSKGDYSFSMRNDGNFVIDATFSITDENLASVPMKFRILDEVGSFVCGSENEWVDIDTLQDVKLRLQPGVSMDLLLEWYWVGDDNVVDTLAGIVGQNDARYILNLQVYAEQVGGEVDDDTHIDVPTGNSTVQYLIIAIIITTVLAIVFIGIDMWLRVKSAREAGAKSHE